MVLSQEEIDGCREAFLAFDKDRSGTIDVWELRQVLEAMGQVIYILIYILIYIYIYIYALGTAVIMIFWLFDTKHHAVAVLLSYDVCFCKEFWNALGRNAS